MGDVRLLVLRQGRPSPMSLLSPREQEIARMVAQGYANKTIASVLEISSWTVASHLRRIFVKLQVSSRAAMVTCLSEIGLNGLLARQDDEMNHPDAEPRSELDQGTDRSHPALVEAKHLSHPLHGSPPRPADGSLSVGAAPGHMWRTGALLIRHAMFTTPWQLMLR